jgi:hypothetical protein
MTSPNRRTLLEGLAFAASGLAATRSLAVPNDGHAAVNDVAVASHQLLPNNLGLPEAVFTNVHKAKSVMVSGT